MRPDGKSGRYHYYAVFANKKIGELMAIALTHIERIDPIAENKVKEGKILNIRLKKLNKYCDSGITNYVYTMHSNKKPIDIEKGIIIINKVSNYSKKKILNFALKNLSMCPQIIIKK